MLTKTRTLTLLATLAIAASPLALARDAASPQADTAFLLEGVKAIESTGIPGPMAAFGPDAFPLVLGSAAKDITAPVVVASRLGKGRVIACGHHGFLETTDKADSGKFLANSVRWSSGRPTAEPGAIRVGVIRNESLLLFLQERGFDAISLTPAELPAQLPELHVICADSGHWGSAENHSALEKFIHEGGGLLTAGLGWGWLHLNPGKSLAEHHPGNQLLARAGILWLDGPLQRTAAEGFGTTTPPPAVTQSSAALQLLLDAIDSTPPADPQLLGHASWILTRTAQGLPANDTLLLPKLTEIRQRGTGKIPSAASPLKSEDAIERLAMTLDLQALKSSPPGQIKPHPASADFPGSVPASAARITENIVIHTRKTGWHSTGLYASPGEVILVTLPEHATGDRLTVRIGCHTDRLWDKPSWSRAPDITTSQPLAQTDNAIASPFGGLLYIDVPGNSLEKDITLTLAGAVKAPRFILGQTTPEDWQHTQRAHPAPWAELETEKIILSVPSGAVRTLDDPTALMRFWDKVMDSQADLAAISRERRRPERIVPDVQISAGYMHSGYPIMTHLDVVEKSLDVAHLTANGSWGHFHELGHNHQSPDWTFDGTVEVTVNLFTLHTYDKVLGHGLTGHREVTPEARERHLKKYFGTDATFDDWKRDPFLALIMYTQMIEAFGWEAFKKTFADYRHLPRDQRPANDDQKRDQWLVRFSTTVGKDLGPFFEAWKIPTFPAARDSLKHLPVWLPEENFPANHRSP